MENKICFLFVVLLLIVGRSKSIDLYSRKGSSASDRAGYDDDDIDKYKYDNTDDDYSQPSTNRRNRYSSQGSTSNNYRSRSRWPSSYEDSYDSNDWSRPRYGPNNLFPNLPGPMSPYAASFENSAFLTNGPGCYSLLDPVYPLFSDICGAVPQARYSLPNAFGHLEKWQIAQVLTAIVNPSVSTNPTCTRSLRLLLCPLLFPPCPTRYEAPPVLPCQSFCRVVKNQCASPSLDLLPCDLLPPASDLCPTNPTPYNPTPYNPILPPFFPPFPLNSILPPSPFSSIFPQSVSSPTDVPAYPFSSPSSFASIFPQSIPSSRGLPSSPFSSMFPQSVPSPTDMPAYPFSSSFPSPTFSSYLSPTMPPSGVSSPSSRVLPSSLASLLSSAGSLPYNQFLNPESYMADSLTPILVDFPPIGYGQDYLRGASRFFPTRR